MFQMGGVKGGCHSDLGRLGLFVFYLGHPCCWLEHHHTVYTQGTCLLDVHATGDWYNSTTYPGVVASIQEGNPAFSSGEGEVEHLFP